MKLILMTAAKLRDVLTWLSREDLGENPDTCSHHSNNAWVLDSLGAGPAPPTSGQRRTSTSPAVASIGAHVVRATEISLLQMTDH